MASAVVNHARLVAPEGFLDPPPSAASLSSYGWLGPRISFSRDFDDDDQPVVPTAPASDVDLDFEFSQVNDPVAMLPADELFSEGKLVPRQVAAHRPLPEAAPASSTLVLGIRSPLPEKMLHRVGDASLLDPYDAISPKAPTCTSRWRELLRLRKAARNSGTGGAESQRSSSKCSPTSSSLAAAATSNTAAARSLKHLLHRNTKSSPSLYSDSPPSPSSSAPDHDDRRPRRSLDADKPSDVSASLGLTPARLRLAPRRSQAVDPCTRAGRPPRRRSQGDAGAIPARSASVDSPRVNSSGRVVFQGLGRSSSSPSALHGGPRTKHRGAERPHSAVHVAPVLNVAVCSLRGSARPSSGSVFGLGQLFSAPQKKDPPADGGHRSASSTTRSNAGGKIETS